MYWTKNLIPTLKEDPQDAESVSHKLMLRAGLIRMLVSGVYCYLPIGFKVLNNIETIIREEMNAIGANELLLSALQPLELWIKSGRDKDIGEVMFRFSDRRGRNLCLGPTHEEVITDLVKSYVSSYRQLPVVLYQIQTKFRDEIRPRFGLVRGCEFIMKDAYSFDRDESSLDKNYTLMFEAYQRIFTRCGLDFLITEADSGVMGGNVSHEFMVTAESGEDIVLFCPRCRFAKTLKDLKRESCPKCNESLINQNTIEVGHTFKLGTKYSVSLDANFLDANGRQWPLIMGCYGIGVSRLIPTIIEQNYDNDGIIWPVEVAPYKVIVLPLEVSDSKIMELASDVYLRLKREKIEVLFDDRDERAGVKFKDADLIGIPLQIIVGKESLKKGFIELKVRREGKKIQDTMQAILEMIRELTRK